MRRTKIIAHVGTMMLLVAGALIATPGVGQAVNGPTSTPGDPSPSTEATEATTDVAEATAVAGPGDGRLMGYTTPYYQYRYKTNSSGNMHSGYNFYFGAANGTAPGGIRAKWVKCGSTATQDAASSVGGAAVSISYNGTIGTQLGSNFATGACVNTWTRLLSSTGTSRTFGYEQYFYNAIIP